MMTWDEYSRLMLCIGRLEGLREALPEETANWIHLTIVDLRAIGERNKPCEGRNKPCEGKNKNEITSSDWDNPPAAQGIPTSMIESARNGEVYL